MNVAQRKLLAIGLDLLIYEVLHRGDGMLLSEEFDRIIERHPIAGRSLLMVISGVVLAHLANLAPERYDVMAQKFWTGRLRRRVVVVEVLERG